MAGMQTDIVALRGGLDLVSSALSINPGALIDAVNFEPAVNGGYRRMAGYERFDGQPAPSAADYWLIACAITGTVAVGNTITGATSGKTAVVVRVNGATELVVTKLSGAFAAGEALQVAAVTQATFVSSSLNGALTAALHADCKHLAANAYRSDILAVPGTGAVRGAWHYNGSLYAFRDSGAACKMYKATTAGWVEQTFGKEVQYSAWSATVTMTIAAPGVITWNAHGLADDTPVAFSTTGALPTGLSAGVTYYVRAGAANTFQVALTAGGASITTSGTQSGTHTCSLVGTAIAEGDTITGATSGATGVVKRVLLRTGTWGSAPVGTLVFDTVTGAFTSGEALKIGGYSRAKSSSASTAIALLAGGRFEFVNHNFGGSVTTQRMYFVDGVNLASEWDGTRLVPIRTGLTTDAPKFIAAWKGMLTMAFQSSVQCSGTGSPYSWTALTGAAELALGDTCTGLLPQPGDANSGALAIFTKNSTYILYGNSSADFRLVQHSQDAGAAPYTAQNIGVAYYLDTKGVVSLGTTQSFGDFSISTLTSRIQPLIDSKRGLAVASCIIRSSNQYRLFFSDGTGLIVNMNGTKLGGLMYFDYGATQHMNTVASFVGTDGVERVIAGGSDGYVYELDKGTSFDGTSIAARMFLAFNSSKSPRLRKRYRRSILQAVCDNTADVRVGYELNYGGSATNAGLRASQTLLGGGGFWDVMTWDQFNWDSPSLTEYTVDTPGNGDNIGLLIYGDSAVNAPFTIHSCILHYLPGRQER